MQFNNIKSIKEFQLFGDSTGYLLSDNATLYAFEGNHTELIPTPKSLRLMISISRTIHVVL